MKQLSVLGAATALLVSATAPLHAAGLPEIRATASNSVPECATPGRLMAMVKARGGEIDQRFTSIAGDYMRTGEELGLRWDYVFFQMMIETGNLTFKSGNRSGEVGPAQNNFAGLGAIKKGDRGESFGDIATGVRAHLQHVQLYAGMPVQNPVADRTRKVQEWRVLESWQKTLKRPMTFADLAKRWAPGADSYPAGMQALAEAFYGDFCKKPDPQPELLAAVRGTAAKTQVAAATPAVIEKVTGLDLAKKAIADAKAVETPQRSGLGANGMAKVPFTLLNAAPQVPALAEPVETTPAAPAVQTAAPAVQTAAVAVTAKPLANVPPPANGQKCRVFTASYGGSKAMIIRAVTDQVVNFTVLDVNEGAEKREADAFISAYAQGGAVAGEFGNQNQALEKAFELCPEG